MTQSPSQLVLLYGHAKPLFLDPQRHVTLGRDKDSDVVLDSLNVSRKHAVIFFQHGSPMILDLNSRNGTFVNDKRVTSAELQHGDVIRIGGLMLFVRARHPERDSGGFTPEALLCNLDTLGTEKDIHAILDRDFRGDFASVSVEEIVQLFVYNRKTGVLILYDKEGGRETGALHFKSGDIVHAESEGLEGVEAAIALLQRQQGRFEFQAGICSLATTVNKPTAWIFLEALRLKDEKENR